jgi:hypothetical protein
VLDNFADQNLRQATAAPLRKDEHVHQVAKYCPVSGHSCETDLLAIDEERETERILNRSEDDVTAAAPY